MVFNYGWAPQLFGASRSGGKRRHAGIDLGTGGRKGVPVGCPLSGFRVKSVSYRKGYGNTVDLISEDGTQMMRFAHLASLPRHLKEGQSIQYGDWLGNVGNSGGNYAIHLHFEYRILENGNFNPINPFNNKYHSFSRDDFEQSTKVATKVRQYIQNGMDLETAQREMGHISNPNPAMPSLVTMNHGYISAASFQSNEQTTTDNRIDHNQIMSVWTLDKTFNEPTLWERYMPQFLGGWSTTRLKDADVQKKLDEEVFRGIQRKEMLQAGLSNQEIDLLRQYVDDQIKGEGVNYRLSAASVPIDFNDVFENPQTAELARNYFDNRANTSATLGTPTQNESVTQNTNIAMLTNRGNISRMG